MNPIMSQLNIFIYLGSSNFPENVKLGYPTMGLKAFHPMGFINYGLYREDLSILAELTISQGNLVNTSGLLN